MAIPSSLLSLRFLTASTPTSTRDGHPNLPVLHVSAPANRRSPLHLRSRSMSSRRTHRLINAIEGGEQDTESGTENSEQNSSSEPETGDATPSGSNLTELGSEIKEALKAKKEMEGDKEGNLWSGVAEEIREIEWPAFGKVLGTTGVVLGVIAGSSIVLLTVNAVLAELSDRVFVGKGVQDFFG